jgi:hypothetical protein
MALTLTVLDFLGDLTMGGATEVEAKRAGEQRKWP